MTGSLRSLCMTSAFGLFRGLWLQEHLQNIVWYSYIPLSSLPCIATIQLRCRRNDRTVGLQQMSRFSSFHLSFHQQIQVYPRQNQYETSAKVFSHPIVTNDNLRVISMVSLFECFLQRSKIIVLPK